MSDHSNDEQFSTWVDLLLHRAGLRPDGPVSCS
jgi:hypothetical protein